MSIASSADKKRIIRYVKKYNEDKKKVKEVIDTIENTTNLLELKNVKQITSGGKTGYGLD